MAKTATIATLVANLEMNSASFRKEMDQARARTKNFTKDLRNTKAANDGFAKSMRGAAQGVVAIDGPLGGVAGRLSAVNGLVTGGSLAWAGLGVAVAGVTAIMYKSVRAAEEMERQQLKIEALLRATDNASGRTAAQLDAQARSVARNTLASVSGVRDAQGVLLTFRSVQQDVFDKAIVLSQDLASVMGGDAKSAALQLGKALEEPSTGLTALRRAGVSFTEAEKEQIRTMEESGRVADAQRMILAKLEQQVGGAGSAEAGGLTGKVDSLGQAWQEFLEAIGETKTAGSSIDWLTGAVDNLRRGLAPTDTELQELEFKELHKQYVWHQEQLAKATREGVQVQVQIQRNKVEQLRSQLQEIQNARIDAQKKESQDALAAEEAAADARAQMERDRAAAELKRQQDSGAAQLVQLDEFLADKRGKRELEHQERLAQIERLQIAELELHRRGFESLEQLKEEYRQRENERYQAELAEAQAKKEEEQQRWLEQENALFDQMTKAQQEQQAEKIRQQREGYIALMDIAGSYFDGMQGKEAAYARVAMALGKTMLDEKKRESLNKIMANTYDAAMGAYNAMASIPYIGPALGAAAAAAVTVAGGAAAAKVAGIAHGGLDYVPAESTYLLDKGERVLSPNQNADLTSALKNGGMGSKVTVNLIEDAGKAGSVERERMEGEDVVRIFVANIREGGDAASALENTYGLQRTGSF